MYTCDRNELALTLCIVCLSINTTIVRFLDIIRILLSWLYDSFGSIFTLKHVLDGIFSSQHVHVITPVVIYTTSFCSSVDDSIFGDSIFYNSLSSVLVSVTTFPPSVRTIILSPI